MCGRYVVVSTVKAIEKRFNVKCEVDINPNYNIGPGSMAPVIASDDPKNVQLMQFGLTPFWAKKKMYMFNARAEGDHNRENDPEYTGARGIISKPAFRKPIRSKRCLVIADCFIEGTTKEKLDKPYVVYLRKNQRPFAMAGIWDEWTDKETGEILRSFSIVTTVPNKLLQKLPHHRSPVILPREKESQWLDLESPLSDITAMLNPYPSKEMNAYPIDKQIKNPRNNGRALLDPVGERVDKEVEYSLEQDLSLEGMGFTRGRQRRNKT